MKNKKAISGNMPGRTAYKRNCPFINNPFDDCYCSSMNSRDTKNVILYCGGVYEECKYYKRTAKK